MFFEIFLIFLTVLIGWQYWVVQQKRPNSFPPRPTGLPIVGYAPFLGLKPHVALANLGKKYGGKIFSLYLGPHRVVVLNDIKDIKEALKMSVFAGRPKEKLLAMQVVPDGIVYNEGRAWEEQRRFAVKVFREFGFGNQGLNQVLETEVRELVAYYRQQGSDKPIDPRAAIQQAAVNAVIFKTLANERFPIGDAMAAKIQRTAHAGFVAPATNGLIYLFPSLAKLIPKWSGYSAMMRAVDQFYEMWSQKIEQHEETMSNHFSRDYIDMAVKKIRNTNDPHSSFYKENGYKQLNNLLTAFFVGATDTLSATLIWFILYMTCMPKIMKRAQKEIDEVIGDSRSPLMADRASMPYMEAIMCETLRHSSILPWSAFHSVMEDTEFGGFKIPKRTLILPNLWAVHRDEKLWDCPNQFEPERFLSPQDGTFRKSMTENLIPFSSGKRICPAESVAMNAFFMMSVGLLQNFTFDIHPDHPLPPLDNPSPGLVLSPRPYRICFVDRSCNA